MTDGSEKQQYDREVPDLIEEISSYSLSDSHHGSSPPAVQSSLDGQGIQHSGSGSFQVNGDLNISKYSLSYIIMIRIVTNKW